jgi:hypothetical protein
MHPARVELIYGVSRGTHRIGKQLMHRARCLHPDARTGWQLSRQALNWLRLVGEAKVPGRLKNANVDPVHADVATYLSFHGGLLGVNLAVSARFLSTGPEGGGKISRTGSVLARARCTVLSLHPSCRNTTAAPPGARNIQGLFESHGRARFACPARSSSTSGSAGLPRERGARHPGAAFFWLLFLAAQEK